MESRFLKIGHRGACGYAPENTLRSFQKAIELGVDMIELDVHLSRDGEIVVIHDERLERTTNGTGEVGEKSLVELKKLDAGGGETIPLLSEVVDLVKGKANLNIELKGKGTTRPVVRLIEGYVKKGLLKGDFLLSSFDYELLKDARRIDQDIRIGLNIESKSVNFKALAKELGATSLHPSLEMTNDALLIEAHNLGLKVYAWTVNEADDIRRLKTMGVDGLFSNFPDRL